MVSFPLKWFLAILYGYRPPHMISGHLLWFLVTWCGFRPVDLVPDQLMLFLSSWYSLWPLELIFGQHVIPDLPIWLLIYCNTCIFWAKVPERSLDKMQPCFYFLFMNYKECLWSIYLSRVEVSFKKRIVVSSRELLRNLANIWVLK